MAGREKQKTIIWTKLASDQLKSILEYWIERTHTTTFAKKLSEEVFKRTLFIARYPLASPMTGMNNIRKSSIKNYSIYYRIKDSEVLILSFWDNRQNPNKLLKLLSQ